MPKFSAASQAKLSTIHPLLAAVLVDAIEVVDFTIIEGHRDQAGQEKAFAEGATKLHWPHGKHNSIPSRAADIAPVYFEVGAKIDWKDVVAFGRLMGVVQACAYRRSVPVRFGLDWDGDFRTVGRDPDDGTFLDAPHVEMLATGG